MGLALSLSPVPPDDFSQCLEHGGFEWQSVAKYIVLAGL